MTGNYCGHARRCPISRVGDEPRHGEPPPIACLGGEQQTAAN